ncbi:hypothetical protein K402DRAFT_417834 [Aulographum hederae CBS 113979]|uniref:Uncharacterized protein n=1 Tax=Aulographum hederae CBS 113979 TaxID=1176131 RepID=A0A6G1HAZ5_9PEZI|nr:hypothetical protein K402DRAFT_417834 [Aulographum hederae CBS 113979]
MARPRVLSHVEVRSPRKGAGFIRSFAYSGNLNQFRISRQSAPDPRNNTEDDEVIPGLIALSSKYQPPKHQWKEAETKVLLILRRWYTASWKEISIVMNA